MRYFISHYIGDHPIIQGPKSRGYQVSLLQSDGTLLDVHYIGYLPKTQALWIPQSRYVKVRALALCSEDNINTCEPMLPDWYLVGLYVDCGDKQGAFVVCDDKQEPLQKFCPKGMAPSPRDQRRKG